VDGTVDIGKDIRIGVGVAISASTIVGPSGKRVRLGEGGILVDGGCATGTGPTEELLVSNYSGRDVRKTYVPNQVVKRVEEAV